MQELARNSRAVSVAVILVSTLALRVGAAGATGAPQQVRFATSDGGEVSADLYGAGQRAVVLAHGAVFDRQSWSPLVGPLVERGLQVLAIDFRGYGRSRVGSQGEARELDILAAIEFLAARGVTSVSIIGASMGGGAAAQAAVVAAPGDIDRLILLAPSGIESPEQLRAGRVIYLTAEGDPSLPRTLEQFERTPEPKQLQLLPGSAHAQHIFRTDHSEDLVERLVGALTD